MEIKEKLKSYSWIYTIGVWFNIFFYDFVVDYYRLCKVKLRKRGILSEKKFDAIKSLKNTHNGERCFIIATGPSLTIEDLELIKNEFTFGVNSLVKVLDKISYIPNFIGIQDAGVYRKIGNLIEQCPIPHVLITDTIYKKYCKDKRDGRYFLFPKYNCRHSSHGDKRPLTSGFSDDVSKVVYDGYSITYSVLQIAVYMGFTEIYILGNDCNYNMKGKLHFVESGFVDKIASTGSGRMIYAYSVAKKWLDENRPDVKVYNATRGGMLEVFPRKTLDDVFKKEI